MPGAKTVAGTVTPEFCCLGRFREHMDRPVAAVVLAGGIGSRLYPASRGHRPKQFLPLADTGDGTSLLERTVARAEFADEVFVSTRPTYADTIADRFRDVTTVVEPAGKDTAPAMLYATHTIRERFQNNQGISPIVVCLPSDHFVPQSDTAAFQAAMHRGASVAQETERLVTFGLSPTRPESGYGYIEPGEDRGSFRELDSFHEKPDTSTARSYVDRGFLWNIGIFAWTPEALFEAARKTDLASLVTALEDGAPERGFDTVESTSIDKAVMEPAARRGSAVVVPVRFDWDDLGAWDALGRVLGSDGDGNTVEITNPVLSDEEDHVLLVDTSDTIVATDDKHVSVIGADGLAVVAFDDRLLVVPREQSQRVRELVEILRDQDRF